MSARPVTISVRYGGRERIGGLLDQLRLDGIVDKLVGALVDKKLANAKSIPSLRTLFRLKILISRASNLNEFKSKLVSKIRSLFNKEGLFEHVGMMPGAQISLCDNPEEVVEELCQIAGKYNLDTGKEVDYYRSWVENALLKLVRAELPTFTTASGSYRDLLLNQTKLAAATALLSQAVKNM